MGRILVVDSDLEQSKVLASDLEHDGHMVVLATGVSDARDLLAEGQFEAVLARDVLRDGEGFDVLSLVRSIDPNSTTLFLSSGTAPELVLTGVRMGVFEFLTTPVPPERLRAAVQRAIDHTGLRRENSLLKKTVQHMKDRHSPGTNGNSIAADLHWIEGLPDRLDLRALLAAVEKSVIEKTLQSTRGAQAEAARRLGLSRSDLSYKLSKYELRKVS
jgi:DNA-binding NtrC family response regulator